MGVSETVPTFRFCDPLGCLSHLSIGSMPRAELRSEAIGLNTRPPRMSWSPAGFNLEHSCFRRFDQRQTQSLVTNPRQTSLSGRIRSTA